MSKWKDKIKGYREQLENRHREEQERKPRKRFGSIFKDLPEGLEFWKCEEARHEVDVVPFLAGPDHPEVPEGEMTYVLPLIVHQNIGPTNENFVCPTDNFNKPCPICEYIIKNRPIPTEEFKEIAGKDRTVYFVWCHDTPREEREGVKVWELADFFFGKPLKEMSKGTARGGEAVLWSDWKKGGKSIAFTKEGTGQGNIRYLGHRFVDRKEDLPDEIMEQTIGSDLSLDSLINMHPTYEEINEAFYGSDRETTPDKKPATGKDCPQGLTMGKDFKTVDECFDCALWDDCQDMKPFDPPPDKEPEKEEKPVVSSRRRRR